MSTADPAVASIEPKLRVFISYSRVDGVFAELVRDALIELGHTVRLDKQDIVPGEEWRKRLDGLILEVEAVLFVISPDSVARWDADSVCAWEIKRTVELGKRLLAVDFRRGPGMTVPRELSIPNHIDATSFGFEYRAVADAFKAHRVAKSAADPSEPKLAAELVTLAEAFALSAARAPAWAPLIDKTDAALNVATVLWERELSRWLARAEAWHVAPEGERDGKLLPIGDLVDLRAWQRQRSFAAPEIPKKVTEFTDASARQLEADRSRQRRIIGRAFVKPAEEALARGETEHALRLAAAGALLANDLDMALVPELWPVAAKAIIGNRTRCVLNGHAGAILTASFSPDGQRAITASSDGTARLWDTERGNEIAVLQGNQGKIVAVSFSSDGKCVATGSDDAIAHLWDATSGNLVAELRGHRDRVVTVTFSPDGMTVVTGSADNTARIWDARSGAQVSTLDGHNGTVWSVAFSPDGSRLVTGSGDHTARVWDSRNWSQITVLKGHKLAIKAASFSPDGKRVVTASTDTTASIWDAESGAELSILSAHEDAVAAASFSQDGERLVTASYDNTARLWDAKSAVEVAVLQAHKLADPLSPDGVRLPPAVSFSPDGRRLVTGAYDGTVRLWDAKNGMAIAVVRDHSASVRSVSFSPDGKRVLAGSDDGTARIWDAASSNEIALLVGHANSLLASLFSPSGGRVLTCSEDNTARIWDWETGAQVLVLRGHTAGVRAASFSPDGRRVVTGSYDNSARLWDAMTGAEISIVGPQTSWVQSASFSPDGTNVVTGSADSAAHLYENASGTERVTFKGHSKAVNSVSFSSDGARLVTASDDHTARLWNSRNGAEIGVLSGHTGEVRAASFDADGKRVATGARDHTARVWNAVDLSEIAILKGHSNWVHSTEFSCDGTRVVTGSFDNTVRLWDAETGAGIAVLYPHASSVHSVSFSPDGTRIVTGSDDKTAKILDVSRSAAATRGRALFLTAGLARGVGTRTSIEATDVLLQEAHQDLFADATRQLGRQKDDLELQNVIAALYAPLHPNCYLSPTQFNERFGFTQSDNKVANLEQNTATVNDAQRSDVDANHAPGLEPVVASLSTGLVAPPPTPRVLRPRIRKYDQRPTIASALAKLALNADAPVRAIVTDPALDNRLKAYEDADADAAKAQRGYRRWAQVALTLMTVATIISSAMLFPLEKLIPASATWRGFISGLQSAANAIALLVVWWLNRSGTAGTWMTCRAEAERLRGNYFRALLLAPAPAGADASQHWRAKLDLVDAAHLDYQRGYLASAERRHRIGASSRAWPRALATFATLAGIAVGATALVAGFGASMPDWSWWVGLILDDPTRWQLGLNTAGSALLAYASARAMVTQDERNAALFAVTRQRLDALRTPERHKAVRDAADRGDGDAALAYVEAAQSILDADHQAWMLNRPPPDPTAPPPKSFKV